jgi:hypothetical protein
MIGFEDQVRQLPATVSLIEASASLEDFAAAKDQLRSFRTLMLWGWMFPFSLLGLIMALVVRSWSDIGRRWGLPLLLGGGGTLLLALFLSAVRDGLIADWLGGIGPDAGPLRDLLRAGLNGLYTAGLRPLWLQAFLVSGIGVLLWLGGRRSDRKVASKPESGASMPAAVDTKILTPEELEPDIDEQGEPPSGIFG